MRTKCPQQKMSAKRPSNSPSFVYRQDGYELSYKITIPVYHTCQVGTVVLPDAKIKIFLTASAEARADRRFKELQEKGQDVPYDVILKEIKERDYQDMNRATAPLKQAEDAVLVDTSDCTFDASVEIISDLIKERMN